MKLVKTTLTDAQYAKLMWNMDLPEDDVPAGAVRIIPDVPSLLVRIETPATPPEDTNQS